MRCVGCGDFKSDEIDGVRIMMREGVAFPHPDDVKVCGPECPLSFDGRRRENSGRAVA